MLTSLLLLAVLSGAPPAAKAAPPPVRPAAPAAPSSAVAGPPLELLIPEQMLEDFLVAVMPLQRTVVQDVSVLGFSQKVNLDLTLSRPRVRVTPAGIGVVLDFLVTGPGGLSAQGRTTPRFELTVVPGQPLLEGRVSGATINETGLELPLDDVIPPFRFPAGAVGPLQVGETTVLAEGYARELALEAGQVRVKGTWAFKKAEAKAAPAGKGKER